MSIRVGRENVLYCHVTLIPYIGAAGELKTKPTQHSVNELRRIGIQPDIIICRSQFSMRGDMMDKIALFCSVSGESIFEALDEETIYRVPISLQRQNLDALVLRKLGMEHDGTAEMGDWLKFLELGECPKEEVEIALVGKYTSIKDAYLSVNEALSHAAIHCGAKLRIRPIETEEVERLGAEQVLSGVHGILVPGGFGSRGVEGKIASAGYAREKRIPYFGLCLGMQVAVIDFARNIAHLASANSSEMDPGTSAKDRKSVV